MGSKDYIVSRLSPKAIRLIARYKALTNMGGKLTDTPDQFYERYTKSREVSTVEAEREFGIQTDAFEERIRDLDGFLGTITEIVDFVHTKLPDGFYLPQEVRADHLSTGAPPSGKSKPTARTPAGKADVAALVKQLAAEKDPVARRKLRRTLRKLGHRGGAREA